MTHVYGVIDVYTALKEKNQTARPFFKPTSISRSSTNKLYESFVIDDIIIINPNVVIDETK